MEEIIYSDFTSFLSCFQVLLALFSVLLVPRCKFYFSRVVVSEPYLHPCHSSLRSKKKTLIEKRPNFPATLTMRIFTSPCTVQALHPCTLSLS